MKRSCFILGCGRSGTSLTAGLLAEAGYFMGDQLFPADDGNPKGYFEDHEINGINEGLLAQLLPGPKRTLTAKLLKRSGPPAGWYRWLAELTPEQQVPCPDRLRERIRAQISRQPFCFKDPRFCYTLGAWRGLAPDAAILCVFRHPDACAASMVKEAQRKEIRIDGAAVDFERALKVWQMMYDYALSVHYPAGGRWLFIHYKQLLDGAAYEPIERLVGTNIQPQFADVTLQRTSAPSRVRSDLAPLYHRLCDLAGYNAARYDSA